LSEEKSPKDEPSSSNNEEDNFGQADALSNGE
ncbi:unnamed protein product, partial [Adineta ricciae]